MSTIKQGIEESVKAFVLSKLPQELAEAEDLTAAKSELLIKLRTEKGELKAAADNAEQVKKLYEQISTDVPSVKAGKRAIHSVLADKSTLLTARLEKLNEDGPKGLGEALIAAAGAASQLDKGFIGMTSIIDSLAGDLEEPDEAYTAVAKHLDELDKAAAKKAAEDVAAATKRPKLMEQLKALKEDIIVPKQNETPKKTAKENSKKDAKSSLVNELDNLKTVVNKQYDTLVSASLSYQEAQPHLTELQELKDELEAAIAAVSADLPAKTKAAADQAAADLAALEEKQQAIQQLDSLATERIPVAVDPENTDEGEKTGNNGGKDAEPPAKGSTESAKSEKSALETADERLKDAKESLSNNETFKTEYTQLITDLTAKKAEQDAFNATIDVHLKPLEATKKLIKDLNDKVGATAAKINAVQANMTKLKDTIGAKEKGLVNSCINALTKIGGIQEKFVDLNTAISQAEFESDIKEYFGKAVTKLAAFPPAGKIVIDNAMLIEHASQDLDQWASQLNHDIGEPLASALKASALNLGKPSKAAAKNKDDKAAKLLNLDEVIEDLKSKLETDEQLLADVKANLDDAWTNAKKNKEDRPSTLEEWKTFLTNRIAEMEEENADHKQTIDFLTKLRPETATV